MEIDKFIKRTQVMVFDRKSHNGLNFGISPDLSIQLTAYRNGMIRLADDKGCIWEGHTCYDAVAKLNELMVKRRKGEL